MPAYYRTGEMREVRCEKERVPGFGFFRRDEGRSPPERERNLAGVLGMWVRERKRILGRTEKQR